MTDDAIIQLIENFVFESGGGGTTQLRLHALFGRTAAPVERAVRIIAEAAIFWAGV